MKTYIPTVARCYDATDDELDEIAEALAGPTIDITRHAQIEKSLFRARPAPCGGITPPDLAWTCSRDDAQRAAEALAAEFCCNYTVIEWNGGSR